MAETDRNTVLDSLTLFGGALSLAGAAKKFGVPRGTIGRWVSERKAGKVVRLAIAPPGPVDSAPRAKMDGREVRATAIAAALGDIARDDLRTAGGNLVKYLRQQTQLAVDGPPEGVDPLEWRPPDMQQVAAAARSLDALLSRAADILAFDRTTQAPAAADQLQDAAAVRAEMLRRKRG